MKIDLTQVQKMLEWFKIKLYLDNISPNSKVRAVKRGQVYRCNFGCGIGSEMQKDRPAVIIQNDVGNSRSGNTIVIPITHDTSTLPCVASITPLFDPNGNILLDGQANASNIMCVSKARLGNYIATLSSADMRTIDEAIAKAVDLMGYYSDLKRKLNSKNTYISQLKEDRNNAQDELARIRKLLSITEKESITDSIIILQKTIDSNYKKK